MSPYGTVLAVVLVAMAIAKTVRQLASPVIVGA